MTDRKTDTALQGLINDILAEVPRDSKVPRGEIAAAAAQVEGLAATNYGKPLRKAFSRDEVKEFISEARRLVWPQLNEQPVTLVSPKEFTRRWSSLGVQFRLAKLSSAEGRGLLGFYIRKHSSLTQPLICVNTAHHSAAVGTAFAHEMGHHLTTEMFGSHRASTYMLYTGVGDHLEDPPELAADLLVSLGAFPRDLLRTSLGGARRTRQPSSSNSPFARVLEYCAKQFGLTFDANLPAPDRVQYLALLTHLIKLRQALFDEFDL